MAETREAHVFETEDGKQVAVEPFNIKEFVSKHKWKIAGGAALIGGGLLLGKKLRNKEGKEPIFKGFGSKIRDLDKPDTDLGDIVDLWIQTDNGEDTLNAIIGDIDINDLTTLAADIADKTFDKYPETKGMTRVDAVLTFWRPEKQTQKIVVIEDSLEKTLETISKIEKAKKEA